MISNTRSTVRGTGECVYRTRCHNDLVCTRGFYRLIVKTIVSPVVNFELIEELNVMLIMYYVC